MAFTSEQDAFLAGNRFSDVEANRALFPSITHAEYVRRRGELRRAGVEVPDLRGRPRLERHEPVIELPDLFIEDDAEALWNAVAAFQASHRHTIADTIKTDVEITVQTERPFGVCFMSDWHIGSIGTDHEALMRDIDLINSCPSLMAYVGGDPVDNFIPEKLAHAGRETQVVSPGFQWKMYRHAIERLNEEKSLLAVGRGNHDAWTSKYASIEGIEQALRGIHVLHTGEDTYIDLMVGEQRYVIYRKHRPIGSSRSHRVAGAKKAYDWGKKLFDVGVTEHHHVASYAWEPRHAQSRIFITTGSYKVEDLHAREWGFMDGGIGTPCVIFWPNRRKMLPVPTIEDAIEHLER